MTDQTKAKRSHTALENVLVLVLTGLGLFLRVWKLDSKNFWLDELGVANAAFQPTLPQALKAANEHIMAMPLDYIIGWITARISHTEGWLRLPEAVWGFLTLLAGYQLCLRLSANKRVALLALLMLALSPILITYSQELRFYSPLIFFFTLSLYFGLEAVQRSCPKDWLIFSLVTLLGIYFHLYVILAVGTVLLWLTPYFGKANWQQRRNAFAISVLVLSVAFLIGLFTFGGVYGEHKLSLFMYEPLSEFLFTGLGWKPPFPASTAGWLLGVLFVLFAVLGVITILRLNPMSTSSLLFYSVIVQVAMVVLFDSLKNYPLFARQIVMLVPTMILFSAYGVDWAIDQITVNWKISLQPSWATAFFGAIVVLAAIPALNEYYQARKGSLHDIYAALSNHWQTPEPIHVEAGVLDVYSYYWAAEADNQSLVNSLIPMDYDSPNGWDYPQPAWFITNYPPVNGMDEALRSAGFIPVYIPTNNTLHPQMLWRRE